MRLLNIAFGVVQIGFILLCFALLELLWVWFNWNTLTTLALTLHTQHQLCWYIHSTVNMNPNTRVPRIPREPIMGWRVSHDFPLLHPLQRQFSKTYTVFSPSLWALDSIIFFLHSTFKNEFGFGFAFNFALTIYEIITFVHNIHFDLSFQLILFSKCT